MRCGGEGAVRNAPRGRTLPLARARRASQARPVRLHNDPKVDLLKGVPLFAGCSKADLQRIASLADELDLAAGATLIREGERGREFIVIVDGSVDVTRKGKTLRTLGSGDFIGEIALVAAVPRTATAR